MANVTLDPLAHRCHAHACARAAVSACGSCNVALVCSSACQARLHAPVVDGGADHGAHCAALAAFAEAHYEHGTAAARAGYADWLAAGMPRGTKRKGESDKDDPAAKRARRAEARGQKRNGVDDVVGAPGSKREDPKTGIADMPPELIALMLSNLGARDTGRFTQIDTKQHGAREVEFTDKIASKVDALPPPSRVITSYAPVADAAINAALFANKHTYARAIVTQEGRTPWLGPPSRAAATAAAGYLLAEVEQGGTTYVAISHAPPGAPDPSAPQFMMYGMLLRGTLLIDVPVDAQTNIQQFTNTFVPAPWTVSADGRPIVTLRGNLVTDRHAARHLAALQVVSGVVSIIGHTVGNAQNEPNVHRLPNLHHIGGNLALQYQPFDLNWFAVLARVDGNLELDNAVGTGHIFLRLISVGGILTIDGAGGTEGDEWPGVFLLLRSVGGLRLEDILLGSSFPALFEVEGNLEMNAVDTYQGDTTFGRLDRIGGTLHLHGAEDSYTDSDFASLRTVGGSLTLSNTSLPAFPSLESVGDIEIRECSPSAGEPGHPAYFPTLQQIGTVGGEGWGCVLDFVVFDEAVPTVLFGGLGAIHGNLVCSSLTLPAGAVLFPRLTHLHNNGAITFEVVEGAGKGTLSSVDTCSDLKIAEMALDSIPVFASLRGISGNLVIEDITPSRDIIPSSLLSIRDILPQLLSVGTFVRLQNIRSSSADGKLVALPWMSAVTTVTDDVTVEGVVARSLWVLGSLVGVGGGLHIVRSGKIVPKETMPALRVVKGTLYIADCANLESLDFINKLESIGGDFFVEGCDSLVSLNGPKGLVVTGKLLLERVPGLTRLAGITAVGGITIN